MKGSIRTFVYFILICALVFALCGCVEGPTQTPIKLDADADETPAPVQSNDSNDNPPQDSDQNAVIEETVLVDQNGVKITAEELFYDSMWGPGVKLLIENDTDKNIEILLNYLIVNDYMITDKFSSTIAAGKKANDTIYLASTDLKAAGITTISEIVTSFSVYDSDSFDTLLETDEIAIRTSAYGTVEQPALDEGKELFNQEGIRIVGRYFEEDSLLVAGIKLFIENYYGQDIIVQCEEMSVNGYMVIPYYSCLVNNGRMALSELTVTSSDLEDNNIEKIEEIELVFLILDTESFDTLIKSSPVTFAAE